MLSKEAVMTNEEIEYEVIIGLEIMVKQEFIHRVEKSG